MKKTLILTALLLGFCSFNTVSAQPAPECPPGPGPEVQSSGMPEPPFFRYQSFHEQMLFKPDLTDMLLENKELNLTEKQVKALKKTSKTTTRKVRKLDKKIRDAKDERIYLVGEHFKEIQDILTDEQKETLYAQHQKQIEEKMAKFEKQRVVKPACKCGEKCTCTPKCTCNEKKPCPVKSKCKQSAKPTVQPKPQPVKK